MAYADFKPFNPEHKGLLHRKLGIPEDQKIPVSKLKEAKAAAKAAGDTKLEREANLALVARRWHHRKGAPGTLHLPKE